MVTFYNSLEEREISQLSAIKCYCCALGLYDIEVVTFCWCSNGFAEEWAKHNKLRGA